MHKIKPWHLLRRLVAILATLGLVFVSLGTANATSVPSQDVTYELTVTPTCEAQLSVTNVNYSNPVEFLFAAGPVGKRAAPPIVLAPGETGTVVVHSVDGVYYDEVDWAGFDTTIPLDPPRIAWGTVEVNYDACVNPDPVIVPVPDQPSVNDPCGPDNASWLVPDDDEVFAWEVNSRGELVVTIVAENTTFPDGSTTYYYGTAPDSGEACPVEPVVIPVPDQPSVNDPCGPDNASWLVPDDDEVFAWEVNSRGELVVTIVAENTTFQDGSTTYYYGTAPDSGEACPVEPPVPPVDPDPGTPGEPVEPGQPALPTWPVDPTPPGGGGDDSTSKDDDTDSDKENVKSDKDNSDTKSSTDKAGKTSADDTGKGQSDKVSGPELAGDGVTPFDFAGLKGLLIAVAVLAAISAAGVGIAARLGHTQP